MRHDQDPMEEMAGLLLICASSIAAGVLLATFVVIIFKAAFGS
jgi:hypothetical protein